MKLSPMLANAVATGAFSYTEVVRVQWMAALFDEAPSGTRVTYGGDMKELLDRFESYLESSGSTRH